MDRKLFSSTLNSVTQNTPSADSTLNHTPTAEIETEILDHFQRHAPPIVLSVNVICAVFLVAVWWEWQSHTQLLVWLSLQTFIVVANGVMYHLFQIRDKYFPTVSNKQWYGYFCLGVLVNGLNWGFALMWFYSAQAYVQTIFMILIVAGLAAGVTTVQAALRSGFILFVVPTLSIPALFIPLYYGISESTVAALLLLYSCAIIYTGFNNHRMIIETIRLTFEKDYLLAEAQKANQAKSLFLANMSHEIRTPMHAILAMADMLRETELSIQQQRYVKTFNESGKHLLNLLNDILDFSRIESGELKLSKEPLHLPGLIDEVFNLMWVQADKKDLNLNYLIDDDVSPWRLGDSKHIRQIVVNLVNNAIKFTHNGEVIIHVSAGNDDGVQIGVVDTGDGIAKDQQQLIFDSFRRGEEMNTDPGGVGLGLAISRRLVDAMGGKLEVTSQVGVGSTFNCCLPLPVIDEPAGWQDRLIKDEVKEDDLPAARILVADDSAMNRMVIQEFLRATQCHIVFAEDGEQAIQALEQESFDLILMDIRMPGLDGLSATRAIRQGQQSGDTNNIPIIALSASASEQDRSHALQAGCDDYLTKPVGKQTLIRTVYRHLTS